MKKSYQLKNKYNNIVLLNFANPRAAFRYLKNKYQIEQEKINSIITKEILTRFIFKKIPYLENFSIKHFDNKATKIISFKNLDILIGWSSFSLASFIKAQKYGCIKILERGSTHIEFQNKILKEEYEINNLKPNLPSRFIIENTV